MKKYMICFVSALVLGFSSCDLMDLKPLDQLSCNTATAIRT